MEEPKTWLHYWLLSHKASASQSEKVFSLPTKFSPQELAFFPQKRHGRKSSERKWSLKQAGVEIERTTLMEEEIQV